MIYLDIPVFDLLFYRFALQTGFRQPSKSFRTERITRMRYPRKSDAVEAFPSDLVADNQGKLFSPDSCSHSMTYLNGRIYTDTCVDDRGVQRRQTFTFDGSGNLTDLPAWMVL